MPITTAQTGATGSHGTAVKVTGPSGLYFLSGINPNPVYHSQPLTEAESRVPADIREQTGIMLDNLTTTLSASEMDWSSVAKIILYLTDIREAAVVRDVIASRFGSEWTPAYTTVQVDNLVTRGARVQLDVIAAGPTES